MNGTSTTFPPPRIPLSPVLSRFPMMTNVQGKQPPPSLLAAKYKRHISSGRAGIALALESANIVAGDEVLIPAYHTDSMIAPVRRIGATPIFYKVGPDAKIDLDDIKIKVNTRTKALLVTHYFGFMQDLTLLKTVCNTRKITLIEDCAHTFFGSINGKIVGQIGDYAIASSMKFFPIYDGGLLVSQSCPLNFIQLDTPPFVFQVKAILNILGKATEYRRFGQLGKLLRVLLAGQSILWRRIKTSVNSNDSGISSGPASADGGYGLDENWINKSTSWPSKKIIEHTDLDQLVRTRRKNYQTIHNALLNITGCHPLYATLPDGAVPLVCPIYIDDPHKHFVKLKQLGVPIWRFGEYLDDEVDIELCKNSVELSAHIFQFPCHQELSDNELDWMIQTIRTQLEQ